MWSCLICCHTNPGGILEEELVFVEMSVWVTDGWSGKAKFELKDSALLPSGGNWDGSNGLYLPTGCCTYCGNIFETVTFWGCLGIPLASILRAMRSGQSQVFTVVVFGPKPGGPKPGGSFILETVAALEEAVKPTVLVLLLESSLLLSLLTTSGFSS